MATVRPPAVWNDDERSALVTAIRIIDAVYAEIDPETIPNDEAVTDPLRPNRLVLARLCAATSDRLYDLLNWRITPTEL